MKKVRLYTKLSDGVYTIMNESTDQVYATANNNVFAEIIRESLEKYLNQF